MCFCKKKHKGEKPQSGDNRHSERTNSKTNQIESGRVSSDGKSLKTAVVTFKEKLESPSLKSLSLHSEKFASEENSLERKSGSKRYSTNEKDERDSKRKSNSDSQKIKRKSSRKRTDSEKATNSENQLHKERDKNKQKINNEYIDENDINLYENIIQKNVISENEPEIINDLNSRFSDTSKKNRLDEEENISQSRSRSVNSKQGLLEGDTLQDNADYLVKKRYSQIMRECNQRSRDILFLFHRPLTLRNIS